MTADLGWSGQAYRVQFSRLEQDLLRTFASLTDNIPKGSYEGLGGSLGYEFVLNAEYFLLVRGSAARTPILLRKDDDDTS